MATYKVIQDIEAEDKLLGPFSLRQFIYLIIVVVSGFVMFKLLTVAWFLAIPLLPHTFFFALLALPFGGDQSTETWLLAKIRFMLKPRTRVWSQTGMQNLVTITAPKKIEKMLTHSFSETEVRSRLQALANTIDSRGWATKNININVFTPAYAGLPGQSTDRLIAINPIQAPQDDANAPIDDMLDEKSNPRAQNLDKMISNSSKAHREKVISSMKNGGGQSSSMSEPAQLAQAPASQPDPSVSNPDPSQAQPNYWFMNNSSANNSELNNASGSTSGSVILPDPSASQQQSSGLSLQPLAPHSEPLTEEELLDKIHSEKQSKTKPHSNLRVIKTLDEQERERQEQQEAEAIKEAEAKALEAVTKAPEPPVTPAPDPDIIELARNNDLNVETVARQAGKRKIDLTEDDEVIINLH